MARQKQSKPLRREISSEYTSKADRTPRKGGDRGEEIIVRNSPNIVHINGKDDLGSATKEVAAGAGIPQLIMAVGGIYASFLTWALLQERLTTTPYSGIDDDPSTSERFTFPVFLNTIQSLFAALTGFIYLHLSTPRGQPAPAIIPSHILSPLLLVSLTTSLASPFGYASLAHIDYITFILAKSCKLLPVMFLHVTLFRRSFPLYKYLVVLAVTAGVAVFTLHASSARKHAHDPSIERNRTWGLLLLGVNLLLDGLTNTTQDYIFTTFRSFSGPQMMCASNLIGMAMTVSWLGLSPYLAHTGIGEYLGMDLVASGSSSEFGAALAFLGRYPQVWWDVLGFAACGAVGQVFIFYTLSHFSSVLLVTVTVTRKMITMILSVLWFGHSLSAMQWLGVGLVFGGVGAEAVVQRREKAAKAAKKAKLLSRGGRGVGEEKGVYHGEKGKSFTEVLIEEVEAAARDEEVQGVEGFANGKKEL